MLKCYVHFYFEYYRKTFPIVAQISLFSLLFVANTLDFECHEATRFNALQFIAHFVVVLMSTRIGLFWKYVVCYTDMHTHFLIEE